MPARRSYKSDDRFLRYISMGAVATRRVQLDLEQAGHSVVELERGSTSFKIWKNIKIKRIRVPDLLCTECGTRVESRAKSAFEISMSHSLSDPDRGWDAGLSGDDYVAIVVCTPNGERPIDWHADNLVQYIGVFDLRKAFEGDLVRISKPKGAQQGYETRAIWPSSVAKAHGNVKSVSSERVQFVRESDNRTITLRMTKMGKTMTPLVTVGESVAANQAVASVAPIVQRFDCTGHMHASDYVAKLLSLSRADRYMATKALAGSPTPDVSMALQRTVGDTNEHIYVRMEAAADLARMGCEDGWGFIESCLQDEYLQNRLECVITLGEIPLPRSASTLRSILSDRDQPNDIRAGAAWALGEQPRRDSVGPLVACFTELDYGIRVEAARALVKLAGRYPPELWDQYRRSGKETRPGLAWALAQSGTIDIDDVLGSLSDNDSRQWMAYILGMQAQEDWCANLEGLHRDDPEVYFAVTVLWKIMDSWVYGLEEYG